MNKSTPRKICVATGTRAEYGLLKGLMREICDSPSLELQTIVTGTHLSKRYGETWKEIDQDGFQIDQSVDIELDDNSALGVARSTGLGVSGCAQALQALEPDLLVLLGDRFEAFACAASATLLNIPIAHFHGGEVTLGAIDESLRHAITKMSHFHFVAAASYGKRVVQMGENKNRVFNVGALGVDNTASIEFLDEKVLRTDLRIDPALPVYLVTFHPVTRDAGSGASQMDELLDALDKTKDKFIVFTMPNADTDSQLIRNKIESFCTTHADRAAWYHSLGMVRYLSLMKFSAAVVGNSSSGIIEAPSLKVPTINIGQRQAGRVFADSVVSCDPASPDILDAFKQVESSSFQKRLRILENPYGAPGAASRSVRILEEIDFTDVVAKEFFDIEFTSEG